MGFDPVTLAFMAVSTGLNLYSQSKAKKDALKAQTAGLAFDAKSAKLEGEALVEESKRQAVEIESQGVLVGKAQKALTARAGVKIGAGTAQDIQEETKFMTAKDVSTVLESAQRKSEQLKETFGVGTQSLISTKRLGQLKEFEKKRAEASANYETFNEPAALLDGAVSKNSNFIQSKKPQEQAIVGL